MVKKLSIELIHFIQQSNLQWISQKQKLFFLDVTVILQNSVL